MHQIKKVMRIILHKKLTKENNCVFIVLKRSNGRIQIWFGKSSERVTWYKGIYSTNSKDIVSETGIVETTFCAGAESYKTNQWVDYLYKTEHIVGFFNEEIFNHIYKAVKTHKDVEKLLNFLEY